jgi:arylsulfatase A-like enzyme
MKYLLQLLIVFAMIAGGFYFVSAKMQKLPNVILISVDTLRADHLSCYGYRRPTPNFDSLAQDSILFENAISQAPWTTASHMSLFTSLYPTVHRVTHEALSEVQITLPSLMQQRGYHTAAFVEAAAMDPRYGFDRGFHEYHPRTDNPSARMNNERVFRWLDHQNRKKPFLLFIHYYDVHRKYEPPAPYNEIYSPSTKNVDHLITGPYGRRRALTLQQIYDIIALYDGEIRYMDDQLAALFETLNKKNLYRDSMIVLFSDHGEGFLDHSLLDHGNSLYQELLHVPVFIKLPRNQYAGKRIDEPIRLIDIFPTILDKLQIRTEQVIQGQSLMPLIHGIFRPPAPALASGAVGSESILLGKWKLIHNAELEKRMSLVPLAMKAEFELYNLESDPLEHGNLAERNTAKVTELLAALTAQRKVNEKLNQRIHTQHKPLDREIEEQLRSLGYIQ